MAIEKRAVLVPPESCLQRSHLASDCFALDRLERLSGALRGLCEYTLSQVCHVRRLVVLEHVELEQMILFAPWWPIRATQHRRPQRSRHHTGVTQGSRRVITKPRRSPRGPGCSPRHLSDTPDTLLDGVTATVGTVSATSPTASPSIRGRQGPPGRLHHLDLLLNDAINAMLGSLRGY